MAQVCDGKPLVLVIKRFLVCVFVFRDWVTWKREISETFPAISVEWTLNHKKWHVLNFNKAGNIHRSTISVLSARSEHFYIAHTFLGRFFYAEKNGLVSIELGEWRHYRRCSHTIKSKQHEHSCQDVKRSERTSCKTHSSTREAHWMYSLFPSIPVAKKRVLVKVC